MSDNVMAYSRGCDDRFFTDMQYAAMLSDYVSLQRLIVAFNPQGVPLLYLSHIR